MTTTTKTKTASKTSIPHTLYNIVPLHTTVLVHGQRAWAHIKTTAAEQRASWVAIGAALAYGKTLNPSTKAFGQWVIENGFGDIPVRTRTDAMWLATTRPAVTSGQESLTHPNNIREAHNEALKATSTPLVDSSMHIQPPTDAPRATREAVWTVKSKVLKVNAHATATKGQEQETAQRYLDKKAAEYGMTAEELVQMAIDQSPEAGLTPSKKKVLDAYMAKMDSALRIVVGVCIRSQEEGGSAPISKEFALAYLSHLFNTTNLK